MQRQNKTKKMSTVVEFINRIQIKGRNNTTLFCLNQTSLGRVSNYWHHSLRSVSVSWNLGPVVPLPIRLHTRCFSKHLMYCSSSGTQPIPVNLFLNHVPYIVALKDCGIVLIENSRRFLLCLIEIFCEHFKFLATVLTILIGRILG